MTHPRNCQWSSRKA